MMLHPRMLKSGREACSLSHRGVPWQLRAAVATRRPPAVVPSRPRGHQRLPTAPTAPPQQPHASRSAGCESALLQSPLELPASQVWNCLHVPNHPFGKLVFSGRPSRVMQALDLRPSVLLELKVGTAKPACWQPSGLAGVQEGIARPTMRGTFLGIAARVLRNATSEASWAKAAMSAPTKPCRRVAKRAMSSARSRCFACCSCLLQREHQNRFSVPSTNIDKSFCLPH